MRIDIKVCEAVQKVGGDCRGVSTPNTGRRRGQLAASYREAMTQITMGGAGVSKANGVLCNHRQSSAEYVAVKCNLLLMTRLCNMRAPHCRHALSARH